MVAPDEIKNYKKDCILIASADYFYEISNILEGLDCENVYDISYLLKLDLPVEDLSDRAREFYDARENYFRSVEATELTIVHLGFCVSERCSLRCRDCSFMMQYYQKPQDVDLDEYKPALDRFLNIVDFISEFRIYGGEPFINRNMYKLLEWYRDCDKINILSIYTNGTIMPDEKTISVMKHTRKVKVHISDYKHNIAKVEKLAERLDKEGITYFVRRYEVWQQGGNLKRRPFTEEQVKSTYARCFMTNCYSFLRGKFYLCPREAHGVNLGAIPDTDRDRVDFTDLRKTDQELAAELVDLMHNRDYIDACYYCNGLDNHVEGVEPAVQINKPLEI